MGKFKYDAYSHLNGEDGVKISIPETARQIHGLNYGDQRMLAEIVRMRERPDRRIQNPVYDENTRKLKELLESGWH